MGKISFKFYRICFMPYSTTLSIKRDPSKTNLRRSKIGVGAFGTNNIENINSTLNWSFSKHRPSGPMLSISRNVRLCVCPSVCLSVCSILRYRLTVFLSPLPEVKCPIFLEIRNPWGKVMERSGLRFENFCLKIV